MIITDLEHAAFRNELRSLVATFLQREAPLANAVERAEAAASGQVDTTLWNRMVGELGVVGLAIPESHGGMGASLADAAVALELTGRHLPPVPLLSSLAAVGMLLLRADDQARDDLLPALASGEQSATLVVGGGRVDARDGRDGWTVSGTVDGVIDGGVADLILVTADTVAGTELFVVEARRTIRTPQRSLDLCRSFARVDFAGALARRVDCPRGGAPEPLARDIYAFLLATEQLGVAQQALAQATEYAQVRQQFGRPIGSFQSVKHLLADIVIAVDLAESAVEHAAWAVVHSPEDMGPAAAMAFLAASDAASHATRDSVQVHGGVGFSWEHPAHLGFRRARSNAVLIDRDACVDRLLGAGLEVSRVAADTPSPTGLSPH